MELNDWTKARFEAIATLALNGLLANPATSSLPYAQLASKAIEAANELDKALSTNVPSPTVTT